MSQEHKVETANARAKSVGELTASFAFGMFGFAKQLGVAALVPFALGGVVLAELRALVDELSSEQASTRDKVIGATEKLAFATGATIATVSESVAGPALFGAGLLVRGGYSFYRGCEAREEKPQRTVRNFFWNSAADVVRLGCVAAGPIAKVAEQAVLGTASAISFLNAARNGVNARSSHAAEEEPFLPVSDSPSLNNNRP